MTGRRSGDQEVATFFDRFAEEYDRAYDSEGIGGRILRRRLETAVELLGSGPGDVLDAGMGSGILCQRLERMGWRAHGIDVSPVMVGRARARLLDAADRLGSGSVLALPFPDASFDAVVCTGVLEYVGDDLPRAVRELARVVRRGGRVVASLPNYASVQGMWRFRVFYPSVRRAKRLLGRTPPPLRSIVMLHDLETAFRAEGMTVLRVEALGIRALPARIALRLEGSRSRLGRAFATQFVVLAKRAPE